jgi:uncharacterized membrane protein
MNYAPMSKITGWTTFFVVSAALFGLIFLLGSLTGTHTWSMFLDMVLGLLAKV